MGTYFLHKNLKDLKDKEIPSFFIWICLSGTIIGLLWTYVLSDMLIDLLGLFVVVFRLNNTFMGLTILGIGNALPDALTTIALAKKGYA
jgi:Ca2+/Na+ antiporter